MKNTLFLLGLLLVNTLAISQSDSEAYRILQKTIIKYNHTDSLSFSCNLKYEALSQEGFWSTVYSKSNRYTAIQNDEHQWYSVLSLSRDQNNTTDFYRFRNTLIRSKWAAENHKLQLYNSCAKTPYYIIKYYDVPFNLTGAGDSLISQTIYIDTLSYLIKSVQSITSYNGQLVLSSFTIDSIDTHEPKKIRKPFQLNQNMLKEGTFAPEFTLKDTDGNTVKLSDYKGKLILLDFWYSACKPCIKASYDLEELSHEYAKRGLVVLGMNTMDKADKARRHNKKHDISYRSTICSRDIRATYKIASYPSFYLINEQGVIVFSTSGYSSALKSDLRSAILMAIANR